MYGISWTMSLFCLTHLPCYCCKMSIIWFETNMFASAEKLRVNMLLVSFLMNFFSCVSIFNVPMNDLLKSKFLVGKISSILFTASLNSFSAIKKAQVMIFF